MGIVRRTLNVVLLTVLACVGLSPCQAAPKTSDPRPSKEGLDFFEKKIRPVLVHNCYECHSGNVAKAKAHLVLDTHDGLHKGGDSGAVVAPGHADNSLLIEAIRYEGLEMPPKGKLSDEVIEDFARWVDMGAPDPRVGKAAMPRNRVDLAEARKFWAFRPPKATPPPAISDMAWPETDIDRYIRAAQEREGLKVVGDADRVTLLRRLSFDLTGLPPKPEEIEAFVKDPSAGALETVVDRLLASPAFGERWGRHWFDVVRYAESTGKERNVPFRYAWRYRDYVIDAFNADKPYDRFIAEQLAGDLLPSRSAADHERLVVATGFLALGPKGVITRNPEQFKVDIIDDQIDVTTRALLGITVACARCHDHKFDPIPTTDYYALAGIFGSSETMAGVAAGKKVALDQELLTLAATKDSFQVSPEQAREAQSRREEIAKLEAQVERLRRSMKQAAKRPPLPKTGKRPKTYQPQAMAQAKVDPKQVREEIKKIEDKIDELEALPTPPGHYAMGMRDSKYPSNANVLVRGEIKDKGQQVLRGVPAVLRTGESSHIDPRHSGRLELARWIANKDNPLTARVMVNRVWEHLLGQGLVDTVDNFGALGDEPSHPELLDNLALKFMEQRWSVKHLIRSIVLSRVYRLSSEHDADNYAKDPTDRFLWRKQPRRLDAEEIRDAMLSASGQLETKRPEASPVLEAGNTPLGGGKNMQELRKPSNARSVYLPSLRGALPEMLQVFDAADPSLIVGKRDVTTVPTQALFLLNNPFVLKQSEEMARRVLAAQRLGPPARIELAYRLALSRAPTNPERAAAQKFLGEYRQAVEGAGAKVRPQMAAWISFCQTLFQCGEFRYVY
jgi:hypothetical protein